MDGHPVYLKWERFLPLFHDPDAKYVGEITWYAFFVVIKY
jgi:hypothetical protein